MRPPAQPRELRSFLFLGLFFLLLTIDGDRPMAGEPYRVICAPILTGPTPRALSSVSFHHSESVWLSVLSCDISEANMVEGQTLVQVSESTKISPISFCMTFLQWAPQSPTFFPIKIISQNLSVKRKYSEYLIKVTKISIHSYLLNIH